MCYTSGTTGNPKGVVYSHRSTRPAHAWPRCSPTRSASARRDVILPVVPMFHANAWGLAHAGVMAGATLVLPGPDLSPAAIAEPDGVRAGDARGRRADDLDGRAARARRAATSRRCGDPVRRLGGAARRCRRRYREKIGMPILQAWGMTETSPLALGVHDQAHAARPLRGRARRPARDAGAARRRWSRSASSSPETGDELPWDGEARGELQVRRPVDRRRLLRRRPGARAVHRRRLAAHRRRRASIDARGLHPARRPHQGPRQVRRRVDQLGRARERDHGPPARSRRRP